MLLLDLGPTTKVTKAFQELQRKLNRPKVESIRGAYNQGNDMSIFCDMKAGCGMRSDEIFLLNARAIREASLVEAASNRQMPGLLVSLFVDWCIFEQKCVARHICQEERV